MHSFNLVTEPWIPVLTTAGMRTVALPDAVGTDVIALASGDDLEDASLLKLLLAVSIAADAESVTAQEWLHTHTEDFDLFHPVRPFGQNIAMAEFLDVEGASRPILNHSYRHAGNGSVASNMFFSECGVAVTPAEAARMLLVRHSFSAGGVQPFKLGLFPQQKHPGNGKSLEIIKGNASLYASRTFAWITEDTLSATLAANVAAVRGLPTSAFRFTWTEGFPTNYVEPSGVLDGLTHFSRSIYLVPGETVTRAMLCEGMRWPSPTDKVGYTADQEPMLLPFTLFDTPEPQTPAEASTTPRRTAAAARAPQKTALTTSSVTLEKTPWRGLLRALASGQPPTAVLAHARPGQCVTVGGLATARGRIDGWLSGTLPVPADGVDASALAELVHCHGEKHTTLLTAQRILRGTDGTSDSEKATRAALILTATQLLDGQMYPVVVAALEGRITLAQADTDLAAIVERADARVVAAQAQTRATRAARVRIVRDAVLAKKYTTEPDSTEDKEPTP